MSPERYAAALILRTASSKGVSVFAMVWALLTAVMFLTAESAAARWSLTIFSKAVTSGFAAQIGVDWCLPPGSSRQSEGGSRKKKTEVKHMNLGNISDFLRQPTIVLAVCEQCQVNPRKKGQIAAFAGRNR
jgi:hypothetical protein